MLNTDLAAARRAGAYAKLGKLALAAIAGLFSLAVAQPALAQFSSQEGYASGAPHWTVEAQPYLWLPATSAKVGLGIAPGLDLSGTSRPTLANVVGSLKAAVTCDCIVRYGNWSGEVDLSYISLAGTRGFPPLLPGQPQRRLSASTSLFLISPGLGYRIWHTDDVSFDARVGFSYSQVDASAQFQNTPLAQRDGRSVSFVQPWIGERFDYYPTPRWRLENTAAITGLGVDGGAIGWNARFGVSYLIASWFDVSLGYAASQTERNRTGQITGVNNTINILSYGPYLATGFRF
jgi:hypothetical protein